MTYVPRKRREEDKKGGKQGEGREAKERNGGTRKQKQKLS